MLEFRLRSLFVIPAEAGIQRWWTVDASLRWHDAEAVRLGSSVNRLWMPAFAGMTVGLGMKSAIPTNKRSRQTALSSIKSPEPNKAPYFQQPTPVNSANRENTVMTASPNWRIALSPRTKIVLTRCRSATLTQPAGS
jgi:hypothetical protein